MSSMNFFSSNQQKPQRRIGRRSMALNSTRNNNTNITLNDHSKNKENIFLSSIKPVLVSSPKSARKVPYQKSRLGRRSMALRTQDIQSEEASLNDSLTRMKNINSSLKLSEPKPSSQPSGTTASQPSFQSSVNSFLNLDRYDFLKKYFPAPTAQTEAPKPSPVKVDTYDYKKIISPAKTESKFESVLKKMNSCEIIMEASESPTIENLDHIRGEEEKEETVDFLKKSLTHHKTQSPTMECSESKYGSFLGDISPREEPVMDKGKEGGSPATKLVPDEPMKESKSEAAPAKPESEGKEDLNRTFELEDDNLLFKTPVPAKFFKRDESLITFKTPMSSVFSRFQNIDDNNDSFVENERTIMLQFKSEPPQVTEKPVSPRASHVIEKPVGPSDTTSLTSNNATATSLTSNNATSHISINATSTTNISVNKDCTRVSLQDFVSEQRKQLAAFVQEQAKQMNEFLDSQNADLDRFIANMSGTMQDAEHATLRNVPLITVSESDNTTIACEGTVLANTTGERTMGESDKTMGDSDRTTMGDSEITVTLGQSETSGKLSSETTKLDSTVAPSVLETTQDDSEYNLRSKPRQSIAFSNFKRNCSILKTPSRSRRSMANTTAVFTPGSLSICIRDQLEALENE
ncbi:hypothetical protein M8J76_008520 [Diaphorina citri]|nr:hypothetical protein M8J76_008520 [Diaphorina citri]